MSGNFRRPDLRIAITRKSLQEALLKLLKDSNLHRITVNDLCTEAQISRPTFYVHFKDKYDLLEFWFANISKEYKAIIDKEDNYIQIERIVNQSIRENTKVIVNLMENANDETLELLNNFMISLLDVPVEKSHGGVISQKYIIFSNFCAGGMLNLLSRQIKNKFPMDLQMMNTHFFGLITDLLTWYDNQD